MNLPTTPQKKYLAQVHNIGSDYAQVIYEMLSKPDFEFSEVQKLSKEAHLWYKERKVSTAKRGEAYGIRAANGHIQRLSAEDIEVMLNETLFVLNPASWSNELD